VTVFFVIDTSYLLEIYGVPTHSSERASAEIRRRVGEAGKSDASFVVPLGCILELGNHIAKLVDGSDRHRFAKKLADDVASSVEQQWGPWVIKPAVDVEEAPQLITELLARAASGVGLVDCATARLARGLKAKYRSFGDYRVHIWTKDSALKSLEPDPEPEPFLG
jgi:hypothetical protein